MTNDLFVAILAMDAHNRIGADQTLRGPKAGSVHEQRSMMRPLR
jgi:hypothetical protein